jgi:xylan 1,4-beta-xylosidase
MERSPFCVELSYDDLPASPREVDITGLPEGVAQAKLTEWRIDQNHSNAYTAWKKMGSPQQPSPDQYAQLEKAGQLQLLTPEKRVPVANGRVSLTFQLPRQGVSLIELKW